MVPTPHKAQPTKMDRPAGVFGTGSPFQIYISLPQIYLKEKDLRTISDSAKSNEAWCIPQKYILQIGTTEY